MTTPLHGAHLGPDPAGTGGPDPAGTGGPDPVRAGGAAVGSTTALTALTALTVWHYTSAMGAAAGEVRLRDLEERGALRVVDAVTLLWMPGTPGPRVGRVRGRTATGSRRGAVLGALAGALVLAPVAGAAAGAGVGALAARLRRTGIDGAFLEEVTARLVPGTSALLVLSEDLDLDAVRPFLERGRSRGDVTLMHATVRDDAPQALRDALDSMPPFGWDSPVQQDPPTVEPPLPSPPSPPSPREHPT
jgi:uncharacterized membrane protein